MRMTADLLDKPFSAMNREERETVIDYADSVKRAGYFTAVRDMADEARHIAELENVSDADELREWVEQEVGGCHWVSHTYANFEVLRWSENHNACMDQCRCVPAGNDRGDDLDWQALAYAAMLADVMEELGDIDELFKLLSDEEADADESQAVTS